MMPATSSDRVRVKYIQSATELSDSWKVEAVAISLGVPYVQVLGHLHLLWWFTSNATLESQEAGDLSRFSSAMLERRMQWTGEAGALYDALITASWLDLHDGTLTVHDWADHSGRGVTQMRAATARMDRIRNDRRPLTPEPVALEPQRLEPVALDPAPPASQELRAPIDQTQNLCTEVLRDVLGIRKLDAVTLRAITAAVPTPTTEDLDQLRAAAEAWKLRGYNPKNVAGVLEWYVGGVPATRGQERTTSARPTASSNMRAIGKALMENATDDPSANRRRSRFSQLLAGGVSPSSSAPGGSGAAIAGLLGGGSTTFLDNS